MPGYVDSASIAGVLMLLAEESLPATSAWTRQSAAETTSVLIFNDNMSIAPGTAGFRKSVGLHSKITSMLSDIARPIQKTEASQYLSTCLITEWLHMPSAREAWHKTRHDESYCGDKCSNWRDVSRKWFWVDHCRILGSLYDRSHIPIIAYLIAEDSENTNEQSRIQKDLTALYEKSTDPTFVSKLASSQNRTHEIRLVEDAFAAAALIRGQFHDVSAQLDERQILHHPIRHLIVDPLKPSQVVQATDVQRYFILLILASALAENSKSIDARISKWAINITKAKKAKLDGRLVFPDDNFGPKAIGEAWDIATNAEIEFPSGFKEASLESVIKYISRFFIGFIEFIPFPPVTKPISLWLEDRADKFTKTLSQKKKYQIPPKVYSNLEWLDQHTPGRLAGKLSD